MLVTEPISVRSRTEIIARWYVDVFPLLANYIQKNGGGLEDAKEVFQEAIVLYYEKLTLTDFRPETSDEAYLLGIAKNNWRKYSTNRAQHHGIGDIEVAEENEEKPITQKLLYYLQQTGEKCMDILQSFYYEKLTMAQLADRYGYKSERSATVQKHKCLEKVRDEVKRKTLTYEDFLK